MFVKKYRPSPPRFYFVSNNGYVEPMRGRDYRAFFLPLGIDPTWFHPAPGDSPGQWEYGIVFAGNSYPRQMNEMLAVSPGFVDTLAPFLGEVIEEYLRDVS